MTAVAGSQGLAPSRRRRGSRATLRWLATHSIAVALSAVFVAPIVFVFFTAVMTNKQALTSHYWPHEWVWSNFTDVFKKAPLLLWFRNTMMYACLATAAMLLSSIPVAYALARLRFRGRRVVFLLVVTMMMLPPQVMVVPMYVVWAKLHLTGTLWPLIIPNFFGDAFSIFLIRQFLLTIPQEYADAARIDGCSEFKVMTRVILPMAKPGIAAAGLFSFFTTWNDYFGPLLYTGEVRSNWPLSLGLASFRSLRGVEWNLTMAITILVMLPVVALFFFAQRAFVEGVTLTGVKG